MRVKRALASTAPVYEMARQRASRRRPTSNMKDDLPHYREFGDGSRADRIILPTEDDYDEDEDDELEARAFARRRNPVDRGNGLFGTQ
jgi:hypothetical protein